MSQIVVNSIASHNPGTDPVDVQASNLTLNGNPITGGHQIQDEGSALPAQPIIDFQGAGVAVADGGTKTIVTIPGGGTYTNANPTPATLGGIVAGSTFSSASIQDMFDALLYPYQNPAFTSFSCALFNTYEVGQNLTNGLSTVNYAISNPTNFLSVQPNGLQSTNIVGATFPVANPLSLVASGSFQINVPVSSNLTSPGTRTVTLSGTNTQSVVFSGTGTMTWRYRVYYGNSANTSLTEPQILALSGNPLAANSPGTYAYAAAVGTYKWICYPSSMTTLTTFTDTGTNLNVPFEALVVISVTNTYGVTTNYNCHRSTNQLGGAITIAMS